MNLETWLRENFARGAVDYVVTAAPVGDSVSLVIRPAGSVAGGKAFIVSGSNVREAGEKIAPASPMGYRGF